MDIEKELTALIAEQLGVKQEQIKPANHFIKDLKADSLDVVELIMSAEEKFELSIPDEEAEKLETVQNFLDYIKSKKA